MRAKVVSNEAEAPIWLIEMPQTAVCVQILKHLKNRTRITACSSE
jgi:hypothetical protein